MTRFINRALERMARRLLKISRGKYLCTEEFWTVIVNKSYFAPKVFFWSKEEADDYANELVNGGHRAEVTTLSSAFMETNVIFNESESSGNPSVKRNLLIELIAWGMNEGKIDSIDARILLGLSMFSPLPNEIELDDPSRKLPFKLKQEFKNGN